MTYERIANFIAVCEHGSMTKAAAKLFISQQSLSHSVAQLEAEVGEQLFIRTAKGVKLTAFGSVFLEKAQAVVDAMEELNRTCHLATNQPITIGVPESRNYSSMSMALEHALARYVKEGTQVTRITIGGKHNESLYEQLIDHHIDAAYFHGPMRTDGIITIPLYSLPLCVLMTEDHVLGENDYIRIEDLKDELFIMPDAGNGLYETIQNACREAGFVPNVALNSAYAKIAVDCVSQGKGIAIVDEQGAVDAARLFSNLKAVRIEPEFKLCYEIAIREQDKREEELLKFANFIAEDIHKNYRYIGI